MSKSQSKLRLKLNDVREIFRLIGEIRELAADPARWRPHMVRRVREFMRAEIVISSEIHFRTIKGGSPGTMRVHDIGWGCDSSDEVWRIQTEQDDRPESYRVAVFGGKVEPTADTTIVPIQPIAPVQGGTSFILSQYPLPHLGAVDQLGIHRAWGEKPFTAIEHRLVRLFHVELGRLWKRDALKQAKDPGSELPPRLAQTLAALQSGRSEKEVSIQLGISAHTVHNYVKALHQRLGVTSRGELLARTPRADGFLPKLSLDHPQG